ncbi:MAG TPA: hypothetical protein VHB25_03820 [Gemmatimonadaceae bacterium]|nr:hypothetical protein [Gemmatimonadaceae bacterium]
MSRRVRIFAQTDLRTDCDVCGLRFDLIAGGTCVRCRKILCGAHLHGSWLRRLLVDFGADPICVACRQANA